MSAARRGEARPALLDQRQPGAETVVKQPGVAGAPRGGVPTTHQPLAAEAAHRQEALDRVQRALPRRRGSRSNAKHWLPSCEATIRRGGCFVRPRRAARSRSRAARSPARSSASSMSSTARVDARPASAPRRRPRRSAKPSLPARVHDEHRRRRRSTSIATGSAPPRGIQRQVEPGTARRSGARAAARACGRQARNRPGARRRRASTGKTRLHAEPAIEHPDAAMHAIEHGQSAARPRREVVRRERPARPARRARAAARRRKRSNTSSPAGSLTVAADAGDEIVLGA